MRLNIFLASEMHSAQKKKKNGNTCLAYRGVAFVM